MSITSSGHRLGQLIGDWFEEYFVLPLLEHVAGQLNLFLDSRFRADRNGRIIWHDADGNVVDYDYVLELRKKPDERGVPVAFIECFWRRGARHSKDKARDDSGKLMPMRDAYPTARFLGIVAAGDFTAPARELVRSREIDLFYIPKDKIVNAFSAHKLMMDYPDSAPETDKYAIAETFSKKFNHKKKIQVNKTLLSLVGETVMNSYLDRVRAKLSALPQEIRLILRHDSMPVVFESVMDAGAFLDTPHFDMLTPRESYAYEITYSDGSEFEKSVDTLEALRQLHMEITLLTSHMESL